MTLFPILTLQYSGLKKIHNSQNTQRKKVNKYWLELLR
jgi:hypothetical protein